MLARFLLGQLVLHVLRRDAGMRAWYQRIKKRRGSKIARVAVMRRLAVIFWHMLQKRQPYLLATAAALPPKRRGRTTTPGLAEADPPAIEAARQDLGALPPNPRDLSRSGLNSKRGRKHKTRNEAADEAHRPPFELRPRSSAPVASQQSRILPPG